MYAAISLRLVTFLELETSISPVPKCSMRLTTMCYPIIPTMPTFPQTLTTDWLVKTRRCHPSWTKMPSSANHHSRMKAWLFCMLYVKMDSPECHENMQSSLHRDRIYGNPRCTLRLLCHACIDSLLYLFLPVPHNHLHSGTSGYPSSWTPSQCSLTAPLQYVHENSHMPVIAYFWMEEE